MTDRLDNVRARAKITVVLEVDVACVWADHSLRDVFDAASKQAVKRVMGNILTGGEDRITVVQTHVEAVVALTENRP